MYDKLSRHGRPPRKSHTVDGIIFEIEDDFRTPFESAIGRLAAGGHMCSGIPGGVNVQSPMPG